jgi:hypothetical protein
MDTRCPLKYTLKFLGVYLFLPFLHTAKDSNSRKVEKVKVGILIF